MNARRLAACPSCGGSILRGGKFCPSCGSALSVGSGVDCPACHTECPNHAQFCLACGAPLSSVAEADRRIVTVLFADLSGFTQLTELMDPEDVRELVADCLGRLSECVRRWGGFVDKFIGDCVMALFGAPVAYENEEERAIRAALDMHEAIREWSKESPLPALDGIEYQPQLTIGINSGPVVTGVFGSGSAQNYTAVGDTVNVASRLQGLCERGCVLVGPNAFEKTRHLFEFEDEQALKVKGRREPVSARYVIGERAERGKERGFLGKRPSLVGRVAELAELTSAWKTAADGDFQIRLVVGPAGIGKTRLVEALIEAEGLSGEQVARGRSYPYASSTPWEPIAELIHSLYHLDPELTPAEAAARVVRGAPSRWPPERLAGLKVVLGSPLTEVAELGSYSPTERVEWIGSAVTAALQKDARTAHLLILEDVHWADSTTLEFLGRLSRADLAGPVLLVLVSRPALPDEVVLGRILALFPDAIEPLPFEPNEARAFIEALLEQNRVPTSLIDRIVERAGGNPLFVEESLKSLVEHEALVQEDGVWVTAGDIDSFDIPDSIESVLTTRIDRLDKPTKQVLQYAAIVGRRFWSGVLSNALIGRSTDAELDALVQAGFIAPVPASTIPGEREFRFEHLLLQETAYEGMLRGLRSELHRAIAEWFEDTVPGADAEFAEQIAYHYERSVERERALPYLERAAVDARDRGALVDAHKLADRALSVAGGGPEKLKLLLLVEDIALAEGDGERRRRALEEMESIAGISDDDRYAAEAVYRRARYLLHRGDLEAARERAEDALAGFEKLGDVSLQGDALRLRGRIAHTWGDYPLALRFYRSSLELEQEAGDRYGQAEIFNRLGLVQVDIGNFTTGLDYFRAARDLFEELGDRPSEARVLANEGTALRWLGRYDEAEASAQAAVDLAERCGSRDALADAELNLAMVLAARDQRSHAEPLLRNVAELALHQLDKPALAARAFLVLGQLNSGDEARECSLRARELGRKSGLVHVEILALTRDAQVALELGDLQTADRSSREAMDLLKEHFNIQGSEEAVIHTRARVLRALGRDQDAEELAGRARTIVQNKADRIEDPELRVHYLESIPLNREILGEERVS